VFVVVWRRGGRGKIFNNQSEQGLFEIPHTNPMGKNPNQISSQQFTTTQQ
jgi:hypothetical protein